MSEHEFDKDDIQTVGDGGDTRTVEDAPPTHDDDTRGPGISEPEKATGTHTSTAFADRVADDEGQRGPHVEETGVAQHSVYDGSGQEIVVVTTTDESGRPAQGSGRSVDEALKDARKGGYPAD